MKRISVSAVRCLLTAACLVAATGCATEKYGKFEPKNVSKSTATDVSTDYDKAMASTTGRQMAYEWQRKHAKEIEAATRPEVLKQFVATEAAACKLLGKIGTCYDGDPLVLTQISAVTQLVMCPKCEKAKACRKRWVSALKRTRAKTDDGYVRTFCDQQLRLCE